MDLDHLLRWAPVAFTLINAIFTATVWLVSRSMVSRSDLRRVEERIGRLETAPGWSPINELRDRVSGVEGDIKGLRADMAAVREQTRLIYEHMLAQ